MSDVQESYPTPTSGIGAPLGVTLAGSGVTQVKGHVYTVTLSLTGTSSVAITATAVDAAGTTASPAYTGSFHFVSRASEPLTANSGDVVESYPASTSGVVANIASFNSSKTVAADTSTANPSTVYGHTVGQAIVECFIPFGDADGSDDYLKGGVYAQLIVNVNP